jgi:hypothetical protein
VFKWDAEQELLVIRARHHGEWHETVVPLELLLEGTAQATEIDLYNAVRAQR